MANLLKSRVCECLLNKYMCGQPVRENVKCVTEGLPSQLYSSQTMELVRRMLAVGGGGAKLQLDTNTSLKLSTIKLLTQRVHVYIKCLTLLKETK